MSTEADTCRHYVLPKLLEAGWDTPPHSFTEQKTFTDGRIVVTGTTIKRRAQKRADYLLRYTRDFAIAVVEAKSKLKSPGAGLQQAKDYAEILGLKFAYATNGHGIIEFDYLTGQERENGSVAVVTEALTGCYASNEFPIFKPMNERLDPKWFHWLTKTRYFWTQCDLKSRGTSGKNRIRPEKFLEIEIPLPPLKEQERIVTRIEELAAKIEEARRLREQSAAEIEALMHSASRSAFSNHGSFDQCQLEDVCSEIIDCLHSNPVYSETGIPTVRSPDEAGENFCSLPP